MRDNSEMFDRANRHQQTMFVFIVCEIFRCTLNDLSHLSSIIGMYPLQHGLHGGCGGAIIFEDAIGFVGPDNFSAVNTPPKAARMAEMLSLREIRFAPLQRLRQLLLLSDVHPGTHEAERSTVLGNRSTYFPQHSSPAIRPDDAILELINLSSSV